MLFFLLLLFQHEPATTKCIAVTFNADINLTKDVVSKIKSFSVNIQKNEQKYSGADCQSTLKQINLAVDFISNCTKHETFRSSRVADSIKRESVLVSATSNKSLFEILVSIQYAIIASNKITIVVDEKRAYLKDLLVSLFMFQVDTIDADYPITESLTFCTQIIFDSADFQSAFNVLAAAFTDTTSPWKIRSCWIQDTLRTKFFDCFPSLLANARQLSAEQQIEVENILTKSKQFDATVFQSDDKNATFLVGITKKHIDSDLCVVVNFFRTAKEVVSLVQATDQTNSISLWSESITLAYDVADKLDVENVWINSNGLLHPEVPFTFGRGADKQIYGSKLGIVDVKSSFKILLTKLNVYCRNCSDVK